MNTAQTTTTTSRKTNNRLVDLHSSTPNYEHSDTKLIVELMQLLQKTKQQAEENPKEAELNKTTMSDNNGGRIIYNFNIYQIPQILDMLRVKRNIKKNHIEP